MVKRTPKQNVAISNSIWLVDFRSEVAIVAQCSQTCVSLDSGVEIDIETKVSRRSSFMWVSAATATTAGTLRSQSLISGHCPPTRFFAISPSSRYEVLGFPLQLPKRGIYYKYKTLAWIKWLVVASELLHRRQFDRSTWILARHVAAAARLPILRLVPAFFRPMFAYCHSLRSLKPSKVCFMGQLREENACALQMGVTPGTNRGALEK